MTQGKSHGSDGTAHSSSMVGLRTVVMLSFLVAIPLMALVGAGLPDSVRRLMQGGSSTLSATDGSPAGPKEPALAHASNPNTTALVDSAPQAVSTAPTPQTPGHHAPASAPAPAELAGPALAMGSARSEPRATVTGVRVRADLPRATITDVRTRPDEPAPAATAPLWAPTPRTAATPVSRQTTAHFEISGSGDRLRAAPSAGRRKPADAQLQATAYSTTAANDRTVAVSKPSVETTTPGAADALARGEARLRELGASHYRLESWGGSGNLYRCTASVSLASRRASRQFQAVAATPGEALEQLLSQIESSRGIQR